jgi:NAD(P)-dependent dehydrogenase (short-subunit alcohol dehydrogenase family)
MTIRGKVAIITGAGKGIGRGIARAYASEGAKLVLVSRTLAQVEDAADEARAAGAQAAALAVDVSKPDDVRRMVEYTLERFSRVDVLVNNAAILGPVGPLHLNDAEHWAQAVNINVTGLMLCCHAVLPHMIEQGGGKIINLSGAGVTRASETISAYGTTKAAVVRLTETLALEMLPHNVSVNALGPGQIDTDLLDSMASDDSLIEPMMGAMVRRTKSGRGAPLEEAAALAVWLASDASDGLTGRLISATQDDWRELGPRIPQIMASDLYTLRFNA